jgi:hypothetical protein
MIYKYTKNSSVKDRIKDPIKRNMLALEIVWFQIKIWEELTLETRRVKK